MSQKQKSRTDEHQAALETSTAWTSRFYSTTLLTETPPPELAAGMVLVSCATATTRRLRGMALPSELGESGFDLFNQWSSQVGCYKAKRGNPSCIAQPTERGVK